MGIFNKIFGNREEIEYKATLAKVSNPLMDKIDAIEEREIRDFFNIILDIDERSLRGILFMSPIEFNFKKQMTIEDIEFWLRKVSLALISYSYYFYGDAPGIKKNQDFANLVDVSYKAYWQRMFDYYNQIFNENIGQKEIDYYASGLKEDCEKGYSKSGNMEKVGELTVRDYKAIALELLEKIWNVGIDQKTLNDLQKYKPGYGMENLDPKVKKMVFLGDRIWQAHQQIVQPFLTKLLREY